jgi:hypothetical protein
VDAVFHDQAEVLLVDATALCIGVREERFSLPFGCFRIFFGCLGGCVGWSVVGDCFNDLSGFDGPFGCCDFSVALFNDLLAVFRILNSGTSASARGCNAAFAGVTARCGSTVIVSAETVQSAEIRSSSMSPARLIRKRFSVSGPSRTGEAKANPQRPRATPAASSSSTFTATTQHRICQISRHRTPFEYRHRDQE